MNPHHIKLSFSSSQEQRRMFHSFSYSTSIFDIFLECLSHLGAEGSTIQLTKVTLGASSVFCTIPGAADGVESRQDVVLVFMQLRVQWGRKASLENHKNVKFYL